MHEVLQEFTMSHSAALAVDRPNCVIRGVKILGLESKNGRSYLPEALAKAAALYEGVRVNVNHPRGNPASPRDYEDRLGSLKNVVARPDGLFGDLHFNPKHKLAEQLAWDAEHAPQNVGLSHNVEARTARRGEAVVVESIVRVQGVDLVADPASTKGLYESQASGDPAVAALHAEIRRLRDELDQQQAHAALAARRGLVERLIGEARLPRELASELFVEQCQAAADETAIRRLIADRAAVARGAADPANPRSIEQRLVESYYPATSLRMDAKEFAQLLIV